MSASRPQRLPSCLTLSALVFALACSDDDPVPAELGASSDLGLGDQGASVDAGSELDLGEIDLGSIDAGSSDVGPTDASTGDQGPVDLGASDSGASDAGASDSGLVDLGLDGGRVDQGGPDLGPADTGAPDLGGVDSGGTDIGPVDTGPPDLGSSDMGERDLGASDAGGGACVRDSECAPAEFCLFPVGACGGTGRCQLVPTVCPGIFQPVCGCNQMTYGNECNAWSARQSVRSTGQCP